jgi:hypothetical protein
MAILIVLAIGGGTRFVTKWLRAQRNEPALDPVVELEEIVKRRANFTRVQTIQRLNDVGEQDFNAILQEIWKGHHPDAAQTPWASPQVDRDWREFVDWDLSEVQLAVRKFVDGNEESDARQPERTEGVKGNQN